MPIPPRQRKPNIVLIIMDDLAFGDLACHGNPHTATPHLDALHHSSKRFTQYCSGPLCTPARASLMTGRYPYRTRAFDTYIGRSMIDPGEITLPQLLKAQGYATCISGKWHLGDCFPMRAIDMGFDEALVHNSGGLGQPGNPGVWSGQSRYFDPILMHNGSPQPSTGYCTDIFTDHAMAFMHDHRDEPFFCYLATNAPHAPLDVDEKWWKKFADHLPELWARLYGMVENIDYNVGRVISQIKSLGLSEQTIVIYTSDHGPCGGASVDGKDRWNAGLRGRKGTVYDGGVKVPHFWNWPGHFAPGDVPQIANPIDILPTLVNIAGGTLPRDRAIDGVDLGPLLTGDSSETWPDRELFIQWHRGDTPMAYRNVAVRNQQWKLVDGCELYDLAADPGEQHNVAAAHPDRVAAMRDAYEQWFIDVSHTRADNFAPPPIPIGHRASPTTHLSRQDARTLGAEGWGDKFPGYWIVDVQADLTCTVEIQFRPQQVDGTVHLQIPGGGRSATVPAGTDRLEFKLVPITAGRGTICAWLDTDTQRWMVRDVTIHAPSK